MKKTLSIVSFVIFLISVVGTVIWFNNEYAFSKTLAVLFIWALPFVGIVLSFLGQKGFFKITGIIGNGLILLVTGVIPLVVRLFFWNQA